MNSIAAHRMSPKNGLKIKHVHVILLPPVSGSNPGDFSNEINLEGFLKDCPNAFIQDSALSEST